MGVNSLPKTATRQRRGCDLNPGPSAPESSTLTTRLPRNTLPFPPATFPVYTKQIVSSQTNGREALICPASQFPRQSQRVANLSLRV